MDEQNEVSLIEHLANPQHWESPAYLSLWRRRVPLNLEERSTEEKGILIAPMMGRYVFYTGVDEHSPAPEMEKAMQNARIFLAHQLQDLIDEGWVLS